VYGQGAGEYDKVRGEEGRGGGVCVWEGGLYHIKLLCLSLLVSVSVSETDGW
jgi:hypothetical protein